MIFSILLWSKAWSGQLNYLFKVPPLINSKTNLVLLLLMPKPQNCSPESNYPGESLQMFPESCNWSEMWEKGTFDIICTTVLL